jgi:hypothetical protein
MLIKSIAAAVGALVLAIAVYAVVVIFWSYSSGERAGWVQKFSSKGWLCKTWEGEMAMVSMPGTTSEKFYFTVLDSQVAEQVNKVMGKRVSLHYEEKVGIPTSCFGETRHYVTKVTVVEEIPLAPGIVVPTKPAEAAPAAPAAPAASPAPAAPAPAAPAAPAPAAPEKK